ncbi:carboxylate/amino acid/amine transporter [Kingella denitrificans]|nr:carboxylate/amino acid/amine transporter [Kingella denitrificans]
MAAVIFVVLSRWSGQRFPANRRAQRFALLAGAMLGADLSLWHESIYAVGPGISTLLNSLQIFWLSMIGVLWFKERLSLLQTGSLLLAVAGVVLIGSPEFRHNGNALWGFVSGVVSGLMLSLSMVFVRKAHQEGACADFPDDVPCEFGRHGGAGVAHVAVQWAQLAAANLGRTWAGLWSMAR